MRDLLYLLRHDWRRNFRYQGGLPAVARCLLGDRRLRRGRALAEPEPLPRLDCTVFSVIPELSALWAVLFERVIRLRPLRVLLGDCSGGLRGGTAIFQVPPLLNTHHGEKLDLFFAHLCRAEFVLVTDDDIFWLDEAPLLWALERIEEDPEIAVVSLAPKRDLSEVLAGKVERAMGSILLIRRRLWMEENMLFRVVVPPPEEGLSWIYDTGEFAQVQLTRRGYRIEFGPHELRQEHLITFGGVSSWTLKLRKFRGELGGSMGDDLGTQVKALQTVLVVRELEDLLEELLGAGRRPEIVPPPYLDRGEELCLGLLSDEWIESTRTWVRESIERIRNRLLADGEPPGAALERMLGG